MGQVLGGRGKTLVGCVAPSGLLKFLLEKKKEDLNGDQLEQKWPKHELKCGLARESKNSHPGAPSVLEPARLTRSGSPQAR